MEKIRRGCFVLWQTGKTMVVSSRLAIFWRFWRSVAWLESQLLTRDNCWNRVGTAPLHYAAIRGNSKRVESLLSRGAWVNIRDWPTWRTPLHYAALSGDLLTCDLLLRHGARPKARDREGLTPLHFAMLAGHLEIVKILIPHFGFFSMSREDTDGWNYWHWAGNLHGHIQQFFYEKICRNMGIEADPNKFR